jgi:hypothetical protein
MYSLVSWQPGRPVIVPCLSLGDAWRMLHAIGRGAIFRCPRPTGREVPIYPCISTPKGRAA